MSAEPGSLASSRDERATKRAGVRAQRAEVERRIAQANASPAAAIEQSVGVAARSLGVTHERVLRNLLAIAESPLETGSARVSALRVLADVLGTKRTTEEPERVHPHDILKHVPTSALEERLMELARKYIPEASSA